jgi:hypothetical protein
MKKILLVSVPLVVALSLFLVLSKQQRSTKEEENPSTVEPISFTCPKEQWINCMPTISDPSDTESTKKRELECSETYLKWAKESCPGFEGAAY